MPARLFPFPLPSLSPSTRALAAGLVRLPWPLPALLAWAAGWAAWWLLRAGGAVPALALGAGLLATTGLACTNKGGWRKGIAAAGFPLSALASGLASSSTAALPPWAWLLLLAPVLLAYPLRAWRDAPFFPTPAHALQGLDALITTPQRVLDAGCGLGHGLAALHRLWPTAQLHGIEWSPALAWLTALRCRLQRWPGQASRGDMWAASWAGFDVVYVFQRPESMARAFAKAQQEMAADAVFVSLEFAVAGQEPVASLQGDLHGRLRRPVWVYKPAAVAVDGPVCWPDCAPVCTHVGAQVCAPVRALPTARQRSTNGEHGR